MGRPVVHFELWSENPGNIAEFYEKVFDWRIRHIPEMNYRLVEPDKGGIGGGIMQPQNGPWPGNMAVYIDVDDLDVYGKRVIEAGGKMIIEKMDVPGVGQLSMFLDPDNRPVGMWKQLEQPASKL